MIKEEYIGVSSFGESTKLVDIKLGSGVTLTIEKIFENLIIIETDVIHLNNEIRAVSLVVPTGSSLTLKTILDFNYSPFGEVRIDGDLTLDFLNIWTNKLSGNGKVMTQNKGTLNRQEYSEFVKLGDIHTNNEYGIILMSEIDLPNVSGEEAKICVEEIS